MTRRPSTRNSANSGNSGNSPWKFKPLAATAVAWIALAGCAGITPLHRHDTIELRSSASLDGGRPRVVLTGPVSLLHMEVEGNVPVTLYQVARQDGDEADCQQPARQVWPTVNSRTGMKRIAAPRTLPDGELLCLVLGSSGSGKGVEAGSVATREARGAPGGASTSLPRHHQGVHVSWHARNLPVQRFVTAELSAEEKRLP